MLEERIETAKEFIETLRITNRRWISNQNSWECSWIFRGHANADWQLVPSAWRNSSLERFKQKYRPKFERIAFARFAMVSNEINTRSDQLESSADEDHITYDHNLEMWVQYFAELQAIKEFVEFADRLGFPVPGANELMNLHDQPVNYKGLPEEDWLINQFSMWTEHNNIFNVNCSCVALAQHHGVPTRLLDWTESPLVAAYFAAEAYTSEKFTKKDAEFIEDRIAVWAIAKEKLSGDDNLSMRPSPLQLVTRPRHEIGYLLAQKGVFTLDKSANKWFQDTGHWRPVEDILGHDPMALRKLTLPVREVGELLKLLWLEGISRAHLMPTYDNVTRALEMKAFWENR